MLTVTDECIFELSGVGSRIPPVYKTYFAPGTHPLNWSDQPPEIKVIIKNLKTQMSEICEKYDDMLAQPVPEKNNFLQASVVGELFYVLLAHESMHVGTIHAMVSVLQNE